MLVTVIVCTYNRCNVLAKALDSLVASVPSAEFECEIVVVDNNSRDQTPDVVENFRRRYPGIFRYVLEARQGVSNARNAGIREARGDVLAFMDDDVIVDPKWLHYLIQGLHGGVWAGAGGRIVPLWQSPPPRWLPVDRPHALAPFVSFDPGSGPGPLNEPPFGANMAFRKEVFEKYGDFRTDLGRCADSLLSNEDTEFANRLFAGGERLRYEPTAVMFHPVLEERLRKSYVLRWWFGKGRAEIAEFGLPVGTKLFLCGIPLFLIRRLGRWTLQWMISIDPSSRFGCKMAMWSIAGQIAECYRRPLQLNKGTRPSRPEARRCIRKGPNKY